MSDGHVDDREFQGIERTPPIKSGWTPGVPERCPRCGQIDCTPECIAAEQTESDAYAGPHPDKYA